ncbi:hypothetical protein M3Y99_01173900 [Aphelenchoides fujianensis]|nr:hypothetical protein M3Y99_01173900 [Aphelenchoides fujianensis]
MRRRRTRNPPTSDEDALLGFTSKPHEPPAVHDDVEQLDYEEEDEELVERKADDKSEAEPKPPGEAAAAAVAGEAGAQEQPAASTATSSSTATTSGGAKCFVNPKFRPRTGNQPGSRNGGLPPSLPPSLFSCPVAMPPVFQRPPVEVMAQNIMMNSLRPLVPPPMQRPLGPMGFGAPPMLAGMPPMNAAALMGGMPPGPPQMSLPPPAIQQDGTVTFRMTIPAHQPRVTVVRAGMSGAPPPPASGDDWASMVDAFLKNPGARRERGRRERDDRRRSRAAPSGRKRQRDRESRRSRDSPRRPTAKRPRSPRIDELKNTIECAEAIGLDQDYVRKLEEQKREREEFQRRKHRQEQRDEARGGDRKDAKREDASSSRQRRSSPSHRHSEREERGDRERDRERGHRSGGGGQSEAKAAQSSASSSSKSASSATRPYLAVVINNLSTLTDAYRRVKSIASAVGPAKKVWQTSDDSVSVIFERHEHAKAFMLQYHMKSFNGITLSIGLEKVFLDLSSIP